MLLARVSRDLRDRGPGPDPAAAQRHHDGAHRDGQGGQLADLLDDVTGLGVTSTRVLTRQRGRHRPGSRRSPGRCWACWTRYSPEFPCLLQGRGPLRRTAQRDLPRGHGSGRRMSLAANQRRPYDRRDRPVYGEQAAARSATACPTPRCRSRRPSTSRTAPTWTRRAGATRDEPPPATPRPRLPRSSSASSSLVSDDRHRHPDRDHGLLRLRQPRPSTRPSFTSASLIKKGDDVRVAGVTVGSVKERRDQGPRRGRGHLQGQGGRAAHRRVAGLDPVPQPGRRPLHGAGAGPAGRASGSPTGPPSRSRAPSRR